MVDDDLLQNKRIDILTRCLTDDCSDCTGWYINKIIGHKLICKCSCGHTRNEKFVTEGGNTLDLEVELGTR